MGDRVYAEVAITKANYLKHKEKCDSYEYEFRDNGNTVSFVNDQANYAAMDITDFLSELEIPYDKSWEKGGDYEGGEEFARKVKGKYLVHEIYSGQDKTLEEFKEILSLKADPEKLIAKLKEKIKELEPFEVTPLDQHNSIDFITEP